MYEFLNATEEDRKLIFEIVLRAEKQGLMNGDKMALEMDLLFAHDKFNLRLNDFLKADSFNFIHDIKGIQNNIDRKNMKMFDFFVPRYSGESTDKIYCMVWIDEKEKWYYFTDKQLDTIDFDKVFTNGYVDYYITVDKHGYIVSDDYNEKHSQDNSEGQKFEEVYKDVIDKFLNDGEI